MPRPSRNEIYEAVIRKMVNQELEKQEQTFAQEHAQDSDEQLLDYLKEHTALLHRVPQYMEIIGWKLIAERFGSWNHALELAGLERCGKVPVSKLPRMQQEVERQKEIYRQHKAEKKLKAQQRLKEQNDKKKQHPKI